MELGCAAFVAFWSHPAWGEWIEMRNLKPIFADAASHPAWGEWIEIFYTFPRHVGSGLTPHGVSGLKSCHGACPFRTKKMSHPAWGEWIEIDPPATTYIIYFGLTPHGVSGLKSFIFYPPRNMA